MRNIWCAFLILISSVSSHALPNPVQNGGFEELEGEFPAGWTEFQAGQEGASFEVILDGSVSYEGNASICLTNLQEGSVAGIRQDVQLSPGSYVLSCYVRTVEHEGATYTTFSMGAGGAAAEPRYALMDLWTHYGLILEIEETTNLAVTIKSLAVSGHPIWIDEVKIRQQPFGDQIKMGLIESEGVIEASGIVASRKNPGVFWTHNDAGNANRIYAFNSQGTHLAVYNIYGFYLGDWEDIAIGPGPVDGENYIYIGNIGKANQVKHIYRIIEPEVDSNQSPVSVTIGDVEQIDVQFPDAKKDAETLMLDPLTKDLYIVSKSWNPGLYRAPYPQSTTETITLEHVATLNLLWAVGGDISSSGLEIVIKDYDNIYYWSRTPEQKLWEAFDNEPLGVSYIREPGGEGVCWGPEASGYYTISEGSPTYLYFYPRLETTPVANSEGIQVIPRRFLLEQNYPNPFNPTTQIRYQLPEASYVDIAIYDVLGRRVEVLADNIVEAGHRSAVWDAKDMASGIYFVRMKAGDLVEVRKMALVR